MKINQENTPPSSVNGDDIIGMEEDGLIFADEVEEIQFELDDEEMVSYDDEMEPIKDDSLLVFNKHNGLVFCCDLHPSGKIAVTGGEDDKAYVWHVDSGELIMECTTHKDSVIFVGFSFDGAFLATVDMGGLIKVWKCNTDAEQSHPWPIVFEYETDDISMSMWHFATRVLISGTFSGTIYVIKIPTGDTKVLQGHNSRVECAKIFPDGKRLVAGYEDGSFKIWDVKSETVIQNVPSSIHEVGITAVDTHPDNNLVATVSHEGKVVLMTSSNGKIVGQIDTKTHLEAVAFSQDPTLDLFALGSLTGSIIIYDVAKQMIRHECTQPGVTKIMWVKDHLLTGCLDGSIIIYNGRSGEKTATLTGHRTELLDFCYNEKQSLILTASDDGTARIFKYESNKS